MKNKSLTVLSDKRIINQFNALQIEAEKKGFIHYEISNFAKKGYFSKHNTSYWKNDHYLGIGPSAHSFNGTSRQWNISSNKKYIEKVNINATYFEVEQLTNVQQYNEYIFTALRTMWGVELNYIENQFGTEAQQYFKKQVLNWIDQEKIEQQNNNYKLTKKGKLYADAIASDLFIV